MSRRVFSSSRRRWRPRRIGKRRGRRAEHRHARTARRGAAQVAGRQVGRIRRVSALTISAASRPYGGQWPGRRWAASLRHERRRGRRRPAPASPDARARRSAAAPRPGASARPARPATWCSNCTVRSAARRSPPARPRSASTTPTSVRCGKCQPLATIWVPMIRSTSRAAMARGGLGGGVRARHGVAGHHQPARIGKQRGRFLGDALHARADRGQAALGGAGGAGRRGSARCGRNGGIAGRAGRGAPPARRCSSGTACGGRRRGTASAARSRGG